MKILNRSVGSCVGQSHHITSHHISSSGNIPYHIVSRHISSHHIILNLRAPKAIFCNHTLSHYIKSHHITSHHMTTYHILSYHTTSHHITSYHTWGHQKQFVAIIFSLGNWLHTAGEPVPRMWGNRLPEPPDTISLPNCKNPKASLVGEQWFHSISSYWGTWHLHQQRLGGCQVQEKKRRFDFK